MSTLVRAGYLLPCNASRDQLTDAFFLYNKGRIQDLGPWKSRPKNFKGQTLDARKYLLMPSLFNLHAHLAMSLFKGLGEGEDLHTWLHEFIFPAEVKTISPSMVKLGTELALCELIRGGVGFVADMYYFPEVGARCIDKSGIRGWVGQSFIETGGFDTRSLKKSFESARKLSKRYKKHPRIQIVLSPHAPYTCSITTLEQTAQLAQELDIGVMIHVAETKKEFADIKRQSGLSPVGLLDKTGILKAKQVLLAHAIWLEDHDFQILARENLSCVLNPKSNAKLGSGVPKVARMKDSRIRFCLGTDGSASNSCLDIFSEMNFLSKLHRLTEGDLKGLPNHLLVEAATIRAAEAVGLESQLGSLEPGKQADFILIDLNKSHLRPFDDLYSLVVNGVRSGDVDSLYVSGKVLMKSQKILGINETKLFREADLFRESLKTLGLSGLSVRDARLTKQSA